MVYWSMEGNRNYRYQCWSCGKIYPHECSCLQDNCDGPVRRINYPTYSPPICGERADDFFDEAAIVLRPCCRCGLEWMCTWDEWIEGECPNCNASGPYGKGGSQNINIGPTKKKKQTNGLIGHG